MWAIKKNRPLFYGIPFEIYTDHQPLRNLLSLAEKVPRVQRWHDFLSAYTYVIKYKPGRVNANADMLSRLPQPPSNQDISGDTRITDPDDMDVYFIGASRVWPRILKTPARDTNIVGETHSSNLNGLDPGAVFQNGEEEVSLIPFTSNEAADQKWTELQNQKGSSGTQRSGEHAKEYSYAVPDSSPLLLPQVSSMMRGQWDQSKILDACPLTEVGRRLLQPLKSKP